MNIFIELHNFFIRIFSGFILNKTQRKLYRAKHSIYKVGKLGSPFTTNKVSGKIYYPIYSKSAQQRNTEYNIYNKNGEKMRTFFIRDAIYSPFPSTPSKYFIFDRFNYGLDVHFYSHEAMLETIGKPNKKYGIFFESENISPTGYQIFDQNKGLEKDFDLIFTFSEKFLNKFDNARLFSPSQQLYCILEDETGNLPANWLENKTKNISILSSDKKFCDLHNFRIELAKKCKTYNLADTFGTFDGGSFVKAENTLFNYRYSIIIENEIESYWFTEKILNCFATMCVPIYLGAPKIGKFFNTDGIITININDFDNIENILKQCNEQDYLSRLSAIQENYYKALKYREPFDLLYESYLKDDLAKG